MSKGGLLGRNVEDLGIVSPECVSSKVINSRAMVDSGGPGSGQHRKMLCNAQW